MKRSRIGISEDFQFTADEIEVADILILFHDYNIRWFPQWGARRRRSGIQRDESSGAHNSKLSPLDISASENEHGGMAVLPLPPPARRLLPTSLPNSKDVKAKNRPSKRAPKKKTQKELTGTVDEMSLENARLMKEVEQRRKRYQDLQDDNVYLKARLTLCLEKQQEENRPNTSRPSSSHSNTRQKTEIAALCDNFESCDERGHFENCSGSSALGSAYDKPQAYDKFQRLGRSMYPCSPESSFGLEKDGAMSTQVF